MLDALNITVERRGRRLLDDVEFQAQAGHVTAIIGPNGAGKSTLLKVLSGELKPDTGSVHLDGVDIKSLGAARLAARRAVVPQATALSFPFTVLEVVMLGTIVPGFGLVDTIARAHAHSALDAVDLQEFSNHYYTELSGGERQRVHVARALCQLAAAPSQDGKTCVLLLDEPTSSLDLAHQCAVLDEARRQAIAGRVVVVVLHDLNLAATYADRVVLLSGGRISAVGSPRDVFTDQLLSETFGIGIAVSKKPGPEQVFVLPQVFARHSKKPPSNEVGTFADAARSGTG